MILKVMIIPYVVQDGGDPLYLCFQFEHEGDEGMMMFAKGTRQIHARHTHTLRDLLPGEEVDEEQMESPQHAAAREASEELGLIVTDPERIEILGVFQYANEFGGEMIITALSLEHTARDRDYRGYVSKSPVKGLWVNEQEFQKYGRDDHAEILRSIQPLIRPSS